MQSRYRIVKSEWFDDNNKLHVEYIPQKRTRFLFWSTWSPFPFFNSEIIGPRSFKTFDEAKNFLDQVGMMGGQLSRTTVMKEN